MESRIVELQKKIAAIDLRTTYSFLRDRGLSARLNQQ